MEKPTETQLPLFSSETHKELEEIRRQAKEQLKYHSLEAERCRQLVMHYNAILCASQNGQHDGEKSDGSQNESALMPTEFVVKLLNESPDRWISIQEFLFKARSAFDAGEVINRTGEIENSIHTVLTRFRNNRQVWTKGKRKTRKYKLKP